MGGARGAAARTAARKLQEGGPMNVDLELVLPEKKQALKNLVKMYCYEWSQYNGIDIDQNGEYAFERDLDRFFSRERHFPYFTLLDGKIAGFVLVDDDFDVFTDSDHAISEFFILHKYRRMGIGKRAAIEAITRHPGKWEIKMHPRNKGSIGFWRAVAEAIVGDDYAIVAECEKARYFDGSLGTVLGFSCRSGIGSRKAGEA